MGSNSFPKWTELPEKHRKAFVAIASSFGIEKDGEYIFPTQDIAEAWAIEMYALSIVTLRGLSK